MQKNKGFTLIEVSIVLLIIGLALSGLLAPLGTRIDDSKRLATQNLLKEMKQALINFSITSPNARLPCPDTNADGVEDVTLGNCAANVGSPPYATLGVQVSLNTAGIPTDAWGQPLIYHVDPQYADAPPAASFEGTACGLQSLNMSIAICSLTGAYNVFSDSALANQIAVAVPAVLISTGKVIGAPSAAEAINLNTSSTSFVRASYGGQNSNVPFNDTVVWVSGNELVGKLVDAGKLP